MQRSIFYVCLAASMILGHGGHDHGSEDESGSGNTTSTTAHNHDEESDGTELAVGLFTLGIVIVTLIPVFFPLQNYFSEKRIGYIRCFSGGVFLSMGLFHMMQHAIIEFRSVDLGNYNDGFPLILGMLGYFLILFIERVMFADHDHDDPLPVLTPVNNDGEIVQNPKRQKSSTVYVIMVALSIHAVFEGIALGVQHDVAGVASLAIGILAHKWAESLSLAVALQNQGTSSTRRWVMLLIFTMVTPVGVGIGLIISKWSSSVVSATTQALAAGTFIYISCSERFVREFDCPKRERYLKFLAALAGAGMIIGVAGFHTH